MKRLSGLSVWLVMTLTGAATHFAAERAGEPQQDRPDLTGVVVNDAGEPVRDASVFIYTAGPRVGPGYI